MHKIRTEEERLEFMQANENDDSYESYVPDDLPREDLEGSRRPEIEHPIPDEET